MTRAGKLNLLIQQGSDFVQSLRFKHVIVAAEAAAASTTPTTILVRDLPVGLSSGSTLPFGSVSVTLAANASAGATSISVTAIPARIAADTTATGPAVDLTGYTFAAKLRLKYADTTGTAFTCTVTDAATGLVTVSMADTVTGALTRNALFWELPSEANFQSDSKFTSAILNKAYVWDLEWTTPGGLIERKLEGRVWVTPEATK